MGATDRTPRYLALLRGINVGRSKKVPMAQLRAVIEDEGFYRIKTVLNSGNALFSSDTSRASPPAVDREPEEIGTAIRLGVEAATGVDARVTVLTEQQVMQIDRERPFDVDEADPSRVLISVFAEPQLKERVAALEQQNWGIESFGLGQLAAYTHSPKGVLESRCLKALEKELGDAITTRNLRTFDKLLELL